MTLTVWLSDCLTTWQLRANRAADVKVSSYRRDQGRGFYKGNSISWCLWFFISFAQAGSCGGRPHPWISPVPSGPAVSPHRNTVASRWCLLICSFLVQIMIWNYFIGIHLRLWYGLCVCAYPQLHGNLLCYKPIESILCFIYRSHFLHHVGSCEALN